MEQNISRSKKYYLVFRLFLVLLVGSPLIFALLATIGEAAFSFSVHTGILEPERINDVPWGGNIFGRFIPLATIGGIVLTPATILLSLFGILHVRRINYAQPLRKIAFYIFVTYFIIHVGMLLYFLLFF